MRLILFSILALSISSISINHAFADTLVYQCKMKDGQMNFTDQPCKKDEREFKQGVIKSLALTHSVKPKPIKDEPIITKNEPQNPETVYLVEKRRVIRPQHATDLYYPEPIVVLPYPQARWPNTYSAQPLFNPPLSFKPPLTLQPPSK